MSLENVYTSNGNLIDYSAFDYKNYINRGIQGNVYHYGSDKVIKLLNIEGDSSRYDMVSTIKNLNLPNFSKIYDVLSKDTGPVKSYAGTICKFYENNVDDVWTQPSEYIIESFSGLCDVATVLGKNQIAINDLTPINVILNSDGITAIDFDSFYNVYGGYSDRIVKDNLEELKNILFLPLLFSQFVKFHNGSFQTLHILNLLRELLQQYNVLDTETLVKRLSKYKYPIDYVKDRFNGFTI